MSAPTSSGNAIRSNLSTPVLEVAGLHVAVRTPRGTFAVVRDVGFSLRRGETLGVVGESGSGKTMTALAVMGILPPSARVEAGTIQFEGRDLLRMGEVELQAVRGNKLGMIFQEPVRSLDPAFTVGEQIAEVVRRHRRAGRKAAWQRAVEMLDLVGIPNAARRARDYPYAFSGGMCQRVMLAAALACEPQILIADEPTTALDVTVQAQVLDLMRELREELSLSVLLITHDLGVIADACDRVVVMYNGEIVESASVDALFFSPLHPYTEGLLGCIPGVDEQVERFRAIPGQVPSLGATPPGCRFHPRCVYTSASCRVDVQLLLEVNGDRQVRCNRHRDLDLRGVPE